MTVLRDRVAELRPLFVPPDPAQWTFYRPGELAQFDLWQPDVPIPVGYGQTAKLWTVVGVTGFSRLIGAWMVPSRAAHDVLGGMLHVCRIHVTGTDLEMTVRTTLEVEAMEDGRTVIPARLASEAVRKLPPGAVVISVADGEVLGAFGAVPRKVRIRPPRDHYVRVDTNDYAVNPRFVGRRVDVTVSLDEVVVTCDGTEVARHRRCLARHQTLLAADHARILRQLRVEAVAVVAVQTIVEERDLAVYDRITEAVAS